MRPARPPFKRPARRGSLEGRLNRRPDVGPTDTEIRKRAYALYLTRRGAYGDPVGDWLQAEKELRGQAGGLPLEGQP